MTAASFKYRGTCGQEGREPLPGIRLRTTLLLSFVAPINRGNLKEGSEPLTLVQNWVHRVAGRPHIDRNYIVERIEKEQFLAIVPPFRRDPAIARGLPFCTGSGKGSDVDLRPPKRFQL